MDFISKASTANGNPGGAEECCNRDNQKECEGMIVDMVAAEKENSFQVCSNPIFDEFEVEVNFLCAKRHFQQIKFTNIM